MCKRLIEQIVISDQRGLQRVVDIYKQRTIKSRYSGLNA